MNVWTEIAIGNLLRRRGPPLEVDSVTGEAVDQELHQCKKCGEWKLADDYYSKHDARTGKYRRQSTCKACFCKSERARRPKHPREPRPYQSMLDLMITGPKSLRDLYERMRITRRMAQRMIYVLINDGRVRRVAESKPPTYERKP